MQVLLLKVNKEGPLKKGIWRAPGNQAQVRKLIHVMQHGRLVNIANFSVYTAASVIKVNLLWFIATMFNLIWPFSLRFQKFLAKLPVGIFGSDNEHKLFGIVELEEPEKQREVFCR